MNNHGKKFYINTSKSFKTNRLVISVIMLLGLLFTITTCLYLGTPVRELLVILTILVALVFLILSSIVLINKINFGKHAYFKKWVYSLLIGGMFFTITFIGALFSPSDRFSSLNGIITFALISGLIGIILSLIYTAFFMATREFFKSSKR